MRRKIMFVALLLNMFCVAFAKAGEYTSIDIASGGGSTTPVGTDGFDIMGTGSDMWLDHDHFRFVYRKVDGDFDISANLASLEQKDPWTKAGLMVRQTTEHNSAYVDALLACNGQVVTQQRARQGGMSDSTTSTTIEARKIWLRISRIGDIIITYRSSDGIVWLPMMITKFPMNNPVLVGMCVNSHLEGATSKATYRSLKFSTTVAMPDIELPPEVAAEINAKVKSGPQPIQSTQATRTKVDAPKEPAPYQATDKPLAAALAAGAAKLATDGKTEKAKELCYKSLANNENCADALYELAKILEKENSKSAADFFVRAGRELAQSDLPASATKRADAERRLLKLNPHATRFNAIMSDYAADLSVIVKKTKDTLTQEEVADRINQLRLPSILPPDKIPQVAIQPPAGKTTSGRTVAVVPPDVERALKNAGWEKVTGNWKKVAENVYEVTNGKLETLKINGAVQVTVHKGGTGSVSALVRNSSTDYSSSFYSYASGYGGKIEGGACKLYTPYNPYSSNTTFRPYMEREINLPEAFPKNHLLITVNESHLEIHLNGKRERNADYKISRDGPIIVEIQGTMTIESPMAK